MIDITLFYRNEIKTKMVKILNMSYNGYQSM